MTPIRLNDTNKSTFAFTEKTTEELLTALQASQRPLEGRSLSNPNLIGDKRPHESIFDRPAQVIDAKQIQRELFVAEIAKRNAKLAKSRTDLNTGAS